MKFSKNLSSEILPEELITIIRDLELDEIVDILQNLPNQKTENIYLLMSQEDRQRIQEALVYPEDSAGGLMNTDVLVSGQKHNLEVVMRYLRAQRELPKNTDQIFVVSRENKYLGSLPPSIVVL